MARVFESAGSPTWNSAAQRDFILTYLGVEPDDEEHPLWGNLREGASTNRLNANFGQGGTSNSILNGLTYGVNPRPDNRVTTSTGVRQAQDRRTLLPIATTAGQPAPSPISNLVTAGQPAQTTVNNQAVTSATPNLTVNSTPGGRSVSDIINPNRPGGTGGTVGGVDVPVGGNQDQLPGGFSDLLTQAFQDISTNAQQTNQTVQDYLNTLSSTNTTFQDYINSLRERQEAVPTTTSELMQGYNIVNDPSYQFRLQEGLRALNSSAAARGLSGSGRLLRELTRYGSDYASQEFQNEFNRRFNLANLGLGAAGQQLQGANVPVPGVPGLGGQFGAAIAQPTNLNLSALGSAGGLLSQAAGFPSQTGQFGAGASLAGTNAWQNALTGIAGQVPNFLSLF